MFLKNVFLKTLRDNRVMLLGWGLFLAAITAFSANAYAGIETGTVAERARILADAKGLAAAGSLPGGPAYNLDSFGGYITFRIFGFIPVFLAVAGLMLGSALLRGDDEKGNLDLLLSTPHSRRSILLQKWAGGAVVLAGIVAFTWAGLVFGAAVSNVTLDAALAGLACTNSGLLALLFLSIGVVAGELNITRKGAAGKAGAILAAATLLDNLADQIQGVDWLHYISPLYYHNQSKPLAPSLGTNWFCMFLLLALSLGLVGVAVYFFERRDLSNIFIVWQSRKSREVFDLYAMPEPKSLWLANSFSLGLRSVLPGAFYWALIPAGYFVLFLRAFENIKGDIANLLNNDIYKAAGFVLTPRNESILAPIFSGVIVMVFFIYAIILATGWAGEELNGRLELVLSLPVANWRVSVVRYAVTAVALAYHIGLAGLAFAAGCAGFGVTVDAGNVFAAFAMAWVVGMFIAALGFGVASLKPGLTVGVLGGLVVFGFVLGLIGPSLKLPRFVQMVSFNEQYGKPLVVGLDWLAVAVLVGLSVGLVGVAAWRFERRDTLKA